MANTAHLRQRQRSPPSEAAVAPTLPTRSSTVGRPGSAIPVGGGAVQPADRVAVAVLEAEAQRGREADGIGDQQAIGRRAVGPRAQGAADPVGGGAVERAGERAVVEVPAALVEVLGAGSDQGASAVHSRVLVALQVA